MYFTADSHINTAANGRWVYSAAEEPGLRHVPPPLKTDLEDFKDLPGFEEMKQINQMQSLREFKLIGRSPVITATPGTPEIALGYDRHGLVLDELKTEVFLARQYNQPKLSTDKKEAEEKKRQKITLEKLSRVLSLEGANDAQTVGDLLNGLN